MAKRLILLLALALVAGLTAVAYAEVQNVKVSGDIDMKAVARDNIALRDDPVGVAANTTGYSGSIRALLSIARVRVDADLTDNVSVNVRLLNERIWGDNLSQTTTVHNDDHILLDLAAVTMKEFLYSPLTITLGRQELRFGNGLIIGRPYTNGISQGHGTANKEGLPDSLDDLSSRRTFDAARANFNYDPLIVDLVYARMDTQNVEKRNSTHLWGINAAYSGIKDLLGEIYYWQRARDAQAIWTGGNEAEHLSNLGGRLAYSGLKDLTLGLEAAYQFGGHIRSTALYPDDYANDYKRLKVCAFAIQLMGNYVFSAMKYTPTLGASYTYLSGGKYKQEGREYRAWSGMYEDQGTGTLYNKILGFSNCQLVNLNGSIKPLDDLKIGLNYYYLRLNSPYTDVSTNVVLSGIAGDPQYVMRKKKSLCHEVDVDLAYDYTEDVQLCINGATFLPSSAFSKESNKKSAKQLIGSMKVTF